MSVFILPSFEHKKGLRFKSLSSLERSNLSTFSPGKVSFLPCCGKVTAKLSALVAKATPVMGPLTVFVIKAINKVASLTAFPKKEPHKIALLNNITDSLVNIMVSLINNFTSLTNNMVSLVNKSGLLINKTSFVIRYIPDYPTNLADSKKKLTQALINPNTN